MLVHAGPNEASRVLQTSLHDLINPPLRVCPGHPPRRRRPHPNARSSGSDNNWGCSLEGDPVGQRRELRHPLGGLGFEFRLRWKIKHQKDNGGRGMLGDRYHVVQWQECVWHGKERAMEVAILAGVWTGEDETRPGHLPSE